MQEKTMVADTLAGINGELTRYAGMIAQSENIMCPPARRQRKRWLM